MPRVIRTPAAKQDLLDILERIGDLDPAAAARLSARIDAACRRLADFPYLGSAYEEIPGNLRCFTVNHYVIFYVPLVDGIEVRRVIQGSRDLPPLLSNTE